jgi:hypothetical protein
LRGSLTQRCDDEVVTVRDGQHQVCGRLVSSSACAEHHLCGPPVSIRALGRGHRLEHRCPHNRVRELERILVAQEIDADERARRAQRRFRLEMCERGGQREVGAVTQGRGGAQQSSRFGRKAREASRDSTRDRIRSELEHVRCPIGSRHDPLPRQCVEKRKQKERIASRACLQRCSEQRVGLSSEATAGQHRRGLLAEAAGPNRHTGGVCK